MAQVCEKCGKGPQVGYNVSHSNKKTLRRFNPNLVEKRIFDPKTGKSPKAKICSKCLRTMAKDA
jgi:large subunit ribosomal protein L28